jgi:streptomycin 6-kinase
MPTTGSDPISSQDLPAAVAALDLPPKFFEWNDEATEWLRALPELIEQLAARWSLTLQPHFPGIAINYVAPAVHADGTACVFKLSRHVGETRNEIAALRLWDGDGAARLLAADEELGALLLDRLEPGTMLAEVAETDDDAATRITAGLLRHLWRAVPDHSGLRPLASWCAAYDRNRAALSCGAGGFPAALFQRADALRRDLLASTEQPVVLHGDMHHFNVLRARRHEHLEWLAIDPKGLAGDRHFDICQFLGNPGDVTPTMASRRVDNFCAELGLDRARATDWCFVHAMLDACWDFEDGNPWQRAVAYAEQMLSV